MKEKLKEIYEKQYKKLVIIPIAILIFALGVIAYTYISTGDFVNKGVSLKGGSTITINTAVEVPDLEASLKAKFPNSDISVRSLTSLGKTIGIAVDSDLQESKGIATLLQAVGEKIDLKENKYGVEVIGSSLGSSFFKQTMVAMLLSFLLMAIVVFVYFRNFIPSLVIVLCAFSDIICTLAIFNLTGIKLTTGGIAAFLMLIGYSVDTDMLLTTRVLKRKEGTVMDRVYSSLKTGLTMTLTTLAAVTISMFLVQNETIKQIMIIIFIGLIMDIIMTWIQNVSLLRWYLEKKEHKKVN